MHDKVYKSCLDFLYKIKRRNHRKRSDSMLIRNSYPLKNTNYNNHICKNTYIKFKNIGFMLPSIYWISYND